MNIPLALYVHIPWCVKKCPYCDFNSHEGHDEIPQRLYVDKLIEDLDRDIEDFEIPANTPLVSIFFGGGTPSLFSPSAIGRLLSAVSARFQLSSDAEITLEANPGTTDANHFAGYREAGVNRISLGVQSFGNQQLQHLGRIHTADQASTAYYSARAAGFDNINLDLMHGLPEQNVQGALSDLDRAISLKPEHISWYQLTIEPNTVLYQRPPELPEDEILWQIYEEGTEKLADAGFLRYEISAFSPNQKQSIHNQNYWQFGDYLGIGAGAHGKVTRLNGTELKVLRTNKTRLPSDYLSSQKRNITVVTPEERPLEFLMNGLRLVQGFGIDTFQTRTGLPISAIETFLRTATEKQLINQKETTIMPTPLGLQYLNDLLLMAADQAPGA